MRRTYLLKILVAILLVLGLLVPSAATGLSSTTVKLWIGNASMSVNGVQQLIDVQGTKPVIVAGRTLVPIRAVIEAFDGSVAWDATSRKVTVTLGKDSLSLWIDKPQASLNGIALPIDAANPAVVPVITNGRTMLPLRFVAESLGIDVQYDATSKMITLTYSIEEIVVPPVTYVLTVTTMGNGIVTPATGTTYGYGTVVTLTATPAAGYTFSGWSGDLSGATNPIIITMDAAEAVTATFAAPAPAAPHLVSPATEVILSTLTPTLSWTAVPGATKYEVHIWVASATPPAYVVDEVLATTSYTIPSGVLTASIQYAWTVYAGNSLGWSASLTAPGSTYVPVFLVQAAFQAPSPGVIETQINGEFTGWDGDTIFKLANGQFWQQDSYAYTYHYAYRPNVLIYYVDGRYKMTVEGVDSSIYVIRLQQVIESQIDGTFTGWTGATIFTLTNGQIWQQDSYDYTYHYAYSPDVLIYYSGGRYKMSVEGVDSFIYVVRLK